MPFRYLIVTPIRNEAEYIGQTIQSVVAQTIRPLAWVIVNDGSTDQTAALIDRAAQQHSWIRAVHRSDRGSRRAGTGVMEAFFDGYELVKDLPFEFLVKLDGDLSFNADYFERCFGAFAAGPRLGIGGGLVCTRVNGRVAAEFNDPQFHVRGPTKIYRRECWREIGGLIRAPGWDTFDLVKANMLGWTTRTFSEVPIIHHRPTGGAYGSWSNWTKNGLANYIVGYHPLFMLLKCVRRCFRKPYLVAALGLLVGFFSGYLRRIPQVAEPEVIQYLRSQQMRQLMLRGGLWQKK